MIANIELIFYSKRGNEATASLLTLSQAGSAVVALDVTEQRDCTINVDVVEFIMISCETDPEEDFREFFLF